MDKLSMVGDSHVSIHAPWEGCDNQMLIYRYNLRRFNSRTLGRVRLLSIDIEISTASFNSRTLGRVRLSRGDADSCILRVSIHAPWEGCDARRVRRKSFSIAFQFTHPGKGATAHYGVDVPRGRGVSIHAPWEGCDLLAMLTSLRFLVSIHAPWEGCDSVVQSCVL